MSILRLAVVTSAFMPALALATPGGGESSRLAGYEVGAGITRAGVTVYPVTDTRSPKLVDGERIVPFADALRQGVLTVSEVGHNMQVASLSVHNRGKDPVLVMAGEIVEGGQQDRVIVQDLLLQPTDAPVTVHVNCVERDRWSGGQGFGYGGRAELGLRRVVQVRRSQAATWEAVAAVNEGKGGMLAALGYDRHAMASGTGTYMASMQSVILERQVAKAASELGDELSKEGGVVGIVVAVGDRVVASEVYGYPEVWDAMRDATLAAVARDAMTARTYGSWTSVPDQAVAASFLQAATGGQAVAIERRGTGTHSSWQTDVAHSYALADSDGDLVHLQSYAID